MIVFSAITPHPPIILAGIGQEEDLRAVSKTVAAMGELRQAFERAKPQTVVLVSPHAPLEPQTFGINAAEDLSGDLLHFGLSRTFRFANDTELGNAIYRTATDRNIPAHHFASGLDHGALVPLAFLTENIAPKLVHLSFSFQSLRAHERYGQLIGEICATSKNRVAIVASGDLSHRLTPDAPAGYSRRGKEFDVKVIDCLTRQNIDELVNLDTGFIEEAGECGLRSIVMLLGMLHGRPVRFAPLSYEGPFGVGYLTALLKG